MNNSQPSPPPPLLETLEDGTIEITVAHLKGWVTSFHLVDKKVNELNKAWIYDQTRLP